MLSADNEYQIISLSFKDTQSNTKMAKLQVKCCNAEESFNCVIWQEALGKMAQNILKVGNIVRITGSDYNKQYNNCIIHSLELIKEAKIGLSEEEQEDLFNKILEIVNSFTNEDLKNAVSKVIFENQSLYKSSPAAKSMHHNYVGGLMQHIWECIEFAQLIFPKFRTTVDHDIILAACIMHDIGKMFEYKINLESGVIEVNEKFKKDWISHTQYGFSWAMNNGFKQLARIIAAHHSRTDWEALIDLNQRDLEPELYLMHHIDDLSAKFGLISVNLFKKEKKCQVYQN